MDKYLRRAYQRMNQMSFGEQALTWFISIKLSDFVLKKFENIGAPFFNLILGFILSVIFMTVGMWVLDSIEKKTIRIFCTITFLTKLSLKNM